MQARNSRGMKLVIAELYYAVPCKETNREHGVNIDLASEGFTSTQRSEHPASCPDPVLKPLHGPDQRPPEPHRHSSPGHVSSAG
jgi:hypothetical protein